MSDIDAIERYFRDIDPEVRATLEGPLAGRDLDVEQAVRLCRVHGRELQALCLVADELRRQQVGDAVTYVVNRNVNFTNACVKACKFCAFSRGHRSEEAYFLGDDEIVRRSLEAQALGATEICIQAGLAPGMDPHLYARLCRAIKAAAPELHIHAFSPEEVKYGAHLAKMTIRDYLEELRDAGLGSLPGTSAEVLDDAVRARIAPGRITTQEWVDVVTTAHVVGLPTTSTIMFGHVETDLERMRHLELLRSIQRDTRGITEFVPLSFVHLEAPMTLRRQVPGLREGPTGNDVVRLFAISRLMLGRDIPNLQASWVKEGVRQAQWLLSCGANDLGGTLMNESISTAAGAGNGQFQPPRALRRLARDAGRRPVQRTTRYDVVRAFEEGEDPKEPLDEVLDPEETFGTYRSLTHDERYRFHLVRPPRA